MVRYLLLTTICFAGLTACSKDSEPETQPQPAQPAATDKPGGETAGGDMTTQPDDPSPVVQVPEAASAAFEGYLQKMGDLTGVLEGVKDAATAATASPQVKSLIGEIQGFYDTLEQQAPEVMTQLKEMFGDRIEPAMQALQAQIDRIKADETLAPIAEMLEGLPLLG